jgi:Bax protein
MKLSKKIYSILTLLVIVCLFGVSLLGKCSCASEWNPSDITINEDGVFLPEMPAHQIAKIFDEMGYKLEDITSHKKDVPRIFVTIVPKDMDKISNTNLKKDLFFKMMLPLVLKANEDVLAQRKRLDKIDDLLSKNETVSQKDKLWLNKMSRKYQAVSKQDNEIDNMKIRIGILKLKMDSVSPSLSLVQSAIESAWGTSRFAKEGNALFGEWTWDGTGMVPRGRSKGETHSVKRFSTMYNAVKSYVNNTNRNKAYEMMWTMRAERRKANKPYDGEALASSMLHYSQRGMGYVNTIQSIIKKSKLYGIDSAKLGDKETANFDEILNRI